MPEPSRSSPPTQAAAIALVSAATAFAIASAVYAGVRLAASASLARRSEPFAQEAEPEGARLLVVGDSTAEGTGASAPQASLAGLLGRSNRFLTVVNRGRDGALYEDFVSQLADSARYDAVLVLGGGNDIIRMTQWRSLRASVEEVARRAAALAPFVVLMPPGNVGNAPFFLPPWHWWMRHRSRVLHRIVDEVATESGVRYVSLYKERAEDPFVRDSRRMNAADGLHPSDDGYRLWNWELQAQARLSPHLARIGRTRGISNS